MKPFLAATVARVARQEEVSLNTSTGPNLAVLHRELKPATGNAKQWIKNQNQEMGKDLARPHGPDIQGGKILYLENHPAIQTATTTRIRKQKM